MLVNDKGLAVSIVFPDITGLFQSHHGRYGTGVIKIAVVFIFAGRLDKYNPFGFFAVGGAQDFALGCNHFKFVIGDHIRIVHRQMSVFFAFKDIRPPAGSQNNCAVKLSVRVKGKDIFSAFIVFQVFFMGSVSVQFFAVFIHQLFRRQRKGYVKGDFFTGFFHGYGEFTRLSGNTCHKAVSSYIYVGVALNFLDKSIHHRSLKRFKGQLNRRLAAKFGSIPAKGRRFFYDGNFITGFGCIKCCRHTGYAAADNQHFFGKGLCLVRFGQCDFFQADHTHFDIIFGLHLNLIKVLAIIFLFFGQGRIGFPGMGPYHAFP